MEECFPLSIWVVGGISNFSWTADDSTTTFSRTGAATGKGDFNFAGKLFMDMPLLCSANSDKLFCDVLTKSTLPKMAATVINPARIPTLRDAEPLDIATPSAAGCRSPTFTPMMIAAKCSAVGMNGIILNPGVRSNTAARKGKTGRYFLPIKSPRNHVIKINIARHQTCAHHWGVIPWPIEAPSTLNTAELEPNQGNK